MSSGGGNPINSARLTYPCGNRKFLKNVKINGQVTASNITLVKADLVREEDYLPDKSVNIVILYEFTVSVPLTKIHLEWNAIKHEVIVGVRKLLPTDSLIGNDIKATFYQGNVITQPQKKSECEFSVLSVCIRELCEGYV